MTRGQGTGQHRRSPPGRGPGTTPAGGRAPLGAVLPRLLLPVALLLVTLVAALLVPLTGRAGAQQAGTPTGRLRLAAQTAWVTDDGMWSLRLDVDRVTLAEQLDLVVRFHPAVANRSELTASFEGRGRRGGPGGDLAVPLTSLPFEPDGTLALSFEVGRSSRSSPPGDATGPERRPLPNLREGVYPVTVSLRDRSTGTEVHAFTTHLLKAPDEPAEVPLLVAWAHRLDADPVLQPDGTRRLPDDAAAALVGRANYLAAADLPLSLAVPGQALEGLDPVVLQRLAPALRQALDGGQLLSAGYAPVDARALVDAGLDDGLTRQLDAGDDALRAALQLPPTRATWLADSGVTPAVLAALRRAGIEQVVVPEERLEPLPERVTRTTPLQTFALLDDDGNPMPAVAADAGMADHFQLDDPVLGAHHLLADLAVLHRDAPGTPRGVVIRPPAGWEIDPRFLAVAGAGIHQSVLVRGATLDQLFAEVTPLTDRGDTIRREPVDGPVGSLPGVGLRQARQAQAVAAELAGPTSETAELVRDLVLVAEGDALGGPRRATYLQAALARVETARAGIHLDTTERVRLTAREGRLPITVVNDNPFPVRVSLDLSAERLEFTAAPTRDRTQFSYTGVELPANARETVAVPVRARTSGSFTLVAALRVGDGQTIVAHGRITVVSTAVSGVGIVLSVGALGFLVVWWARHWRRTRRDRAAATSAAAPGDEAPPAADPDDDGGPAAGSAGSTAGVGADG